MSKILDERVRGVQSGLPRHPRVEVPTIKDVVAKKCPVPTVRSDATLAEAMKLISDAGAEAALVIPQKAGQQETVLQCLERMSRCGIRYLVVRGKDDAETSLVTRDELLFAMLAYMEKIVREIELDLQIAHSRGTYSC
jgi:CBS domain-containing protein